MNRLTRHTLESDRLGFEEIAAQLERIQTLENQLIALKRGLVSATSIASIHQKDKDDLTFIVLEVHERSIALPVLFVIEMVQMVELVPISESITGVSGLLNYRGDIIAAIDIGELLDLPKFVISEEKAVAICQLQHFRFALLVDDVVDIVTVSSNEVKVEEEVLPGSLKSIGVLNTNEQTSSIIDLWSVVVSIHTRMSSASRADVRHSIPARVDTDNHER